MRAEDVGGECVQLGGGVGPGVFGHAEFFRAQSGQKLLSRPSGVARDLGKKQSRPAADGQMNPVSGRLEIQRRWGFFQGAENGDFDFKIGQFVTGDGLSEESRIAYHAFGRGYERFAQRFCRGREFRCIRAGHVARDDAGRRNIPRVGKKSDRPRARAGEGRRRAGG